MVDKYQVARITDHADPPQAKTAARFPPRRLHFWLCEATSVTGAGRHALDIRAAHTTHAAAMAMAAAALLLGASAMPASVVISMAATEAASWRAVRTTLRRVDDALVDHANREFIPKPLSQAAGRGVSCLHPESAHQFGRTI